MFRKLAPALVAPLLLITACAEEADRGAVQVQTGAAAIDALRAAPEIAGDAGTASFEMVMTIAGLPGADDPVEMVATGAYDAEAQQMEMEMDLGAMFAGLAESTGEDLPPGADEPAQFVADGTTFYMRWPMLDLFTGGAGWISMTPEDLGQSGTMGFGAGAYDPSQLLELLRGTSEDVEPAGQEDVRGVPTTKYTATVSLDDALANVPADQRDELEAQLDQLGAGDTALPVSVWVDADGLPRRMSMDFDGLFVAMGVGDASMGMTIEYFDYGQPVDIEVPPADEVTSFTDALGGLGGFGGEGS